MFALVRVAFRAFVLGAVVGVLFAPRSGAETRRMFGERFAMFVNQLLDVAAVPPIEPSRARTNGHAERATRKRSRTAEGSGAGASG